MRTLYFTLFIILAQIVSAAPEATWLTRVHDFGAFDENDGRVSCEFLVVNTGNKNLYITSARATCGCATPSFTRDAIAPGDTGKIVVSFNPTGRPGRFDKKIFVETNSLPSRTTLTIKGVVIGSSNTVRSKFPIDAGALKLRNSMIAFGEVFKGRTKTVFLDVYNTTADSIVPVWENVPACITVTPGSPSIPAGDYGSFAINLAADKTPVYGVFDDSLKIRVGDSEPVKFSLVGVIKEDFSRLSQADRDKAPVIGVVPESLDFDRIDVAKGKIVKEIEVKNHGRQPLVLRSVTTADPALNLSVPTGKIKTGKTVKIKVELDPAKVNKMLNARIMIVSNAPDNPSIALRAIGYIPNN